MEPKRYPDTILRSPPSEAVDQELAGGDAVVEDADHAVGLADADEAPVLAGDVGEGTPHDTPSRSRCSRSHPVLVLLPGAPRKFSRSSIPAP